MDRSKKEQVIEELREKLGRASAAILTDYKGLTVAEITGLRDSLAAEKDRLSGCKEHPDASGLQADGTSVLEPALDRHLCCCDRLWRSVGSGENYQKIQQGQREAKA